MVHDTMRQTFIRIIEPIGIGELKRSRQLAAGTIPTFL